jgi:hypothetical protein
VKENRDGEKRARRNEGKKATPTKQNKNDERSLCKLFANSRFSPPPPTCLFLSAVEIYRHWMKMVLRTTSTDG